MRTATAVVVALALLMSAGLQAQRTAPTALIHYREGLRLMGSEQWTAAEREFLLAIGIAPDFELAHYWVGRARIGDGRYVAAIQALETCRGLYLQAAGTRATDQLDAQRRRDDQLREIREVIRERQGGRQSAASDRVITHLENLAKDIEWQKHSGSNMDFELSVPAFVSLSLGSAYFRGNDLAAAEKHYLAAIDANPKMGEAHNNLAVVYLLTGRVKQAAEETTLAEKAGFKVNPSFKEQVKAAQRR
ncbi:MAG TPA: tetratricopeptide repeat protein [Vicinamibacterales bacterium]|nr:tetratricopeptide repeat protein [Vicinamibacterales bacterium]